MSELRALADEFREFYLRSHRVADGMMRQAGVSLARYKLLGFIDATGPVRSADIAESFGYSPRTVTEAIDALEREALIRRDPDLVDRRAKRISITSGGKDALTAASPQREKFLNEIFGGLTLQERRALSSVLARMNGLLEALEVEREFSKKHL